MAERIYSAQPNGMPEVYLFGPAERMLADPEQAEFNKQVDTHGETGLRVTNCVGIVQQIGAEAAFRARKLTLGSACEARRPFAAEGATVISF